jgi:hypothetical protein
MRENLEAGEVEKEDPLALGSDLDLGPDLSLGLLESACE